MVSCEQLGLRLAGIMACTTHLIRIHLPTVPVVDAQLSQYVRKDLESVRHHLDWWRKCKDRNSWRLAVSKLLQNVPSP